MGLTRRQLLAAAVPLLSGCATPTTRRRSASVDRPSLPADADARLGFVGDVMFGRNVDDRWDDRDPAGVWGPLVDRLAGLDGLFLNLECCVSNRGDPRPGRTYHFRASPEWSIPALESAGTTWVSLANNHVLDFGPTACGDTLDHLDSGGIAHAGAGPDRASALAPSTVEAGGLSVGVVAFTDRSRSYRAGPDRPGTAYHPLDPGNAVTRTVVDRTLRRVRSEDPDLLVASLHWGPNWEVEPSATQQAFARWLIDRGVDVVHGHSAHVIQGIEVYRGRPIIYDAGDFVDDYVIKESLHNDRSFLFELVIAEGELDAVSLVPVEIADEAVRPASDEAAAWLRERMTRLSSPFGTTIRRSGAGLVVPLSGSSPSATGAIARR